MDDRAEKEAERIVDAFVADQGPEDLLRLQQTIAAALRRAFERGKQESGDPGRDGCQEGGRAA